MRGLIQVSSIVQLQTESIVLWKAQGVTLQAADFLRLVEENHAFNFQLWAAEDRARRDDGGYEFVYLAKRAIDTYNQQRNDRMESMDAFIWQLYTPSDATDCPVHSETPGMMIDRLSILSLKAYHMRLQVERDDVDHAHREACAYKLQRIQAQKNQLAQCLTQFLDEVAEQTRTFCFYHQFKMYNDKTLNPELYS